MASKITSFQVVDHGIEHSQYFQGCGTAFTEYDECVTGCGDNAIEALEDAIESARQNGARFTEEETESMLGELSGHKFSPSVQEQVEATGADELTESDMELYYYVSIRYSVEPTGVAK